NPKFPSPKPAPRWKGYSRKRGSPGSYHKQRTGRSDARAVDDLSRSNDQPTNSDTITPSNLNLRISVNNKEETVKSVSKTARSLASRISSFPEK
ncbi:hypothetical protein PCASD_00266, partial [Puccinia coronata f. sp. avenae]